MEKLLKIDISNFNHRQIESSLRNNGYTGPINCDEIISLRRKESIDLIYVIVSDDFSSIAYFRNKNTGDIKMFTEFTSQLDSIEEKSTYTLSVDSLLDKISKRGMESLSKSEMEFLNSNR